MTEENIIKEFSAGVIVFRLRNDIREYLLLQYPLDKRILRTKRKISRGGLPSEARRAKGGHWDFPKGHIEDGEDELVAMKRELQEETGITRFELMDGFRYEINYEFRTELGVHKKSVVFFVARTDQSDIELSFEHLDHAWLSYDEAIKRVTYDNAKDVLTQAHKHLNGSE